jgi:TolB-like protein
MQRIPQPPLLSAHPRVAVLPLENLTGQAEASERLTQTFFTQLAATGCCELVEPGQVESALDSLGVRSTGGLAGEPLRALAGRLGASHVLLGSVIESGRLRTPEGDVPSVGVALRLLDASSGRVLWAASRVRTGDDRESLFGWGRERDPERLSASLAAEMLRGFRGNGGATQGSRP